jgi:TRAP-type C4-dicarboxylate transport system substrate-binding protein
MRKSYFILGLYVTIIALFLSGYHTVAEASAKTWTLRYSTGYSSTSEHAHGARWLLDGIAKNSDGRIKVKYHFGGSLVKIGEELTGMRTGIIDCATAATGYFPSQIPLANALGMTYITNSVDAAMKANMEAYNNFAPLRKQFEENNNTIMLYTPPVTNNVLWTTFPVKNMEALRSKKIRAYGYSGDILKAFGATPVGIPWGEIYISAQRGIVEGAYGTPLPLSWDSKLYEVLPHATQTWCGVYGTMGFFFRKNLFDELPQDLQQLVLEWVRKAEDHMIQYTMEKNQKVVDDLVARKIPLEIWSPKERAKAQALIQPRQFNEWIAQMEKNKLGNEARQLKDLYLKAVRKYEKTSIYKIPFENWYQRINKN